jgi:hypothetical protein
MMLPQVGISVPMPAPRNDRIDSVRIADAQMQVPCTISGAKVLGIRWRVRILNVEVPINRAAST